MDRRTDNFLPPRGEGGPAPQATVDGGRATLGQARRLRKSMTDAEVRLWVRLRRLREEGFNFRRQAPFGRYILDFVCFDRRLVIELDGWRHAEEDQIAHDQCRDAFLRSEGFQVLRFWNQNLDRNIADVMYVVSSVLQERPSRKGRRPT